MALQLSTFLTVFADWSIVGGKAVQKVGHLPKIRHCARRVFPPMTD